MLIVQPGTTAYFEFIFNEEGNFYDPTAGATPSDILISVYRGDLGSGPIIDGPYSFFYQDELTTNNRIDKYTNEIIYYGNYGDVPGQTISNENSCKFVFTYLIPENLFPGNYSVVATTFYGVKTIQYTAQFQIPQNSTAISSVYPSGQKELVKSFVPAFQNMEQYKTNSILLIGHADGIDINDIIHITNVQQAIDVLKADFNSPLLRGVFDAYASGAQDIYICATAPMSEYVEDVEERLMRKTIYGMNDSTPLYVSFYERYYSRLEETYEIIMDHEYIDIVVPLETSIINTGEVDFLTQLSLYCQNFNSKTGMIQIGVIGSRNNGIKISDIEIFKQDDIFISKYTMFDEENQIIGDMGRFVIPVYGELIMNHSFLTITYVSSGSAIYAGMLSSNPVNQSMIRKKVPSAFGLSGVTLTQSQIDQLDELGINTFIRNTRSRRGNSYQIYTSNDYTLAHPTSNYKKVPQIRLISMLINEIKSLTNNTVSKFSAQKATSDVHQMLQFLKDNGIINNYDFEAYTDANIRGKLYFDISVVSTLGLKKISFSISAGQGV